MSQARDKTNASVSLRKNLIRVASASAGIRIAGMGFAFLVGIQLARMLGTEGYGYYGLAMSIIAILTIPAQFGLPQLLIREVAAGQVRANWDTTNGLLRWTTRANLLLSLLVAGVVLVLLRTLDLEPALSSTLIVGLLLIPIAGQARLRQAILLGLQHISLGQLPETLLRPALFSLLLLLATVTASNPEPATAMLLTVLSAAGSWLAASMLVRKKLPPELARAGIRQDSRLWRASAIPLALSEGMRVLQGHTSVLILGVLASASAVGLFRVANSVSLLLSLPITLCNIIGAPMISKLHAASDFDELQKLLHWLSAGMVVFSALLALPFFIAGEELLALFFGAEFSGANSPLLILCGGAVLNAAFGPNAVLLNMTGNEKRVTRASGIALLVLLVSAPAMILWLDILGAAIANILSATVWQSLMWRDSRKLLALDPSLPAVLRSLFEHH